MKFLLGITTLLFTYSLSSAQIVDTMAPPPAVTEENLPPPITPTAGNPLYFTEGDSVEQRIILIGDGGALVHGKAPVIEAVRKLIPLDKKSTVVFLGDNLYRHGLPDDQDPNYTSNRIVLDTQAYLVKGTPTTAFFIPGNHDWMNGQPGGWSAIMRQQRYLDAISKDNVVFQPKDGCPGPVKVSLSENVELVMMDSQWWLHSNDKPGMESDCPQKTKEEIIAELEDIVSENDKKLMIFACHHPFRSNGIHGGYFRLKQHIFPFTDVRKNLYIPLPGLGSIYPISRSVFGTPQDLKHPLYVDMVKQVEDVVRNHPHAIFVAGHEHGLQYLKDSTEHFIVSGSGCKTTRVEGGGEAEFVQQELGFVTLEVFKSKTVRLNFYTVKPDGSYVDWAYSQDILNFSSLPEIKDTLASQTVVLYEYKDSVLAPASLLYDNATNFQKFILGYNYRQTWSTPVKFREFNLTKEKGGFKIVGRGGGKQTKSLTLEDKDGNEWKLRTIDKDPATAIPLPYRTVSTKKIVQDMISAAHPYAPMVVDPLAKAAGVLQATPEVYFVPDDPAFGYYQKLFANKICYLERKEPVPKGIKTRSTLKLINHMTEDNDHLVDQNAVLKARLLDMFVGDWDRHLDQWRWAVTDTGKGKLYLPIAKDRDQAFFFSDGAAMQYATRRLLPFLKGFRYDIPKADWLGFSARDFDRLFLNVLSKNDWEKNIDEFTNLMTDDVIEDAVQHLPREIYPLTGDTMIAKLKSRRGKLKKAAMEYYRFISDEVNIIGSNKDEFFDVKGTDTGLVLHVYAREKDGDTSLLTYSRVFDPKITEEIRLYGFNGNDRFNLEGKSKVNIRMIGGRGNDTFNTNGRIKNFVYDMNTEGNTIIGGKKTKNRMDDAASVNDFDITEFQYGLKRFPKFNIGFNSEDGLMAGLGFWIRTHGFRKQPYESDNRLSTLYSIFDDAYNVKYRGEFNSVIGNYDIVLYGDYYNPTLNNFYGLGNETKELDGIDRSFYRARYKYVQFDPQLRLRLFQRKLGVAIGPALYHYWNRYEDNEGRILDNPQLVGLTPDEVYGRKTYLGFKFNMNVHNLNNEFYPTRGIDWVNEFKYLQGIDGKTHPLTRFQSDMTIYASLAEQTRLLAVLRIGGGHIFSKEYDYFQALNIGANNFLRGFRKNRFSGNSLAYTSIELRYKLFTLRNVVVPGSFGVVGFDDVGRVWAQGEKSTKWHNAYGAGIYYLPFDVFMLSATMGFSEEGSLFNFSLGTRLNLYF